ncbi:hypothetical protein [Klebsiella quasipneumoniae]|uniref:hypothetical protein n=1 Tax=Klebsiella quasipneumoniae TaxID=1463165 RepID=UPI00164B99AC|nr:hypothetical protein [Klebsiella quasipneumoniae]MBC4641757.1 hypothetical protein [Klebsiella quasipneumoniae]MBC4693683.1 hypothetical protein [Klebsiella quasipneumoniae]MBC4720354.1 hypothetical protein [Klebsiella quasipneumoniae]MDL4002822.1 hypothetical protein [Klebsiella quasipneumoniae]MDL4052050.1 hypothetical protein [Klebsiella quasipneumoniae]
MTKSTITREESIQAVFDLKVGYTLGLADIEILKRVARMALAAMDSEPVVECEKLAIENFRTAIEGIGHIRRTLDETFGGLHGTHVEPDVLAECKAICDAIYAAYRHAQPAPVVPVVPVKIPGSVYQVIYQECGGFVDCDANAQTIWSACRAAMLNGGKS